MRPEERTIWLEPMRDGMGALCIEAPMVQLIAANNRVTDMAKSLQVDGELHPITQLLVDVVAEVLNDAHGLGGTNSGQGDNWVARFRYIRPRPLGTVPAMTTLKPTLRPERHSSPGSLRDTVHNLAFLCPGPHARKGNTAWKVEQNPMAPAP